MTVGVSSEQKTECKEITYLGLFPLGTSPSGKDMSIKMNVYEFWRAILEQNEDAIRDYFHEDACVNWHCTNEHFSVDEFIIANCEYPGSWDGEVERVEKVNDLLITVTHVYPKDRTASFHVVSFIKVIGDKIAAIDEYWADDGSAPQWRLDKHIGKRIIK